MFRRFLAWWRGDPRYCTFCGDELLTGVNLSPSSGLCADCYYGEEM